MRQYGEAGGRVLLQYPLARFNGSASSAFLQVSHGLQLQSPLQL